MSNLAEYKRDFISFLIRSHVLKFGEFTTKSGRKTPYFINTGAYQTGSQLGRLGGFYAAALREYFQNDFDNLYGPAYKGIPLVTTTSIALAKEHGMDVSVSYNRKEAKDHGERGTLIGHPYDGFESVVIIEDVITAGTSIRESMSVLKANGNPKVCGVLVSVDRMERGSGSRSAIQEIHDEFHFPVYSIVTIREIVQQLHNKPLDGTVFIDDAMKERIEAYLREYGI